MVHHLKQDGNSDADIRREIPKVSGVYVKGSVCGVDVIFTIDTGASSSLISQRIYKEIPKSDRPSMKIKNPLVNSANGKPIKCDGDATFDMLFGPLYLEKPLVVADITDDILLGADVLMGDASGPADLLLSEKKILFRNTEVPIELAGYPMDKTRRVTVADECTIPAMSEKVIEVFVNTEEPDSDFQLIIEPDPGVSERYSLAMASSLVDIRRTVTQSVRVMNPFTTSTTLYQDSLIGYAEPITDIMAIIENEDEHEVTDCSAVRTIETGGRSKEKVTIGTGSATPVPEHLSSLFEETAKNKTPTEVEVLRNFFIQNQDVFSKDDLDIGRTNLTEHIIETETVKPFKSAPRRIPLQFIDEADAAVQKFFDQGTVRESTSPWASPLVFVRKKNGQVRPCVDYRQLNAATRKDAYPLPRTQDCFDSVAGSTLFSSMDITSAYNQIPVREEDIPKTAFVTKHGLFEFTTMPFGLCNAPATFQRLMELALAGLQWKICLIYLDDILVFSKTFDEHMGRLNAVLDRIRKANLKLKPVKCHFLQAEVAYLGHILSAEGVRPNPENLDKVQAWKQPRNVKEVQSFLGLANYYRRFVPSYSYHVRSLIDLTRKNRPFNWTDACTEAFHFVKKELTSPPVMAHPSRDGKFILDTDASLHSIGAVLSQEQKGEIKVLAYGSKSLSKTERNYCVNWHLCLDVPSLEDLLMPSSQSGMLQYMHLSS